MRNFISLRESQCNLPCVASVEGGELQISDGSVYNPNLTCPDTASWRIQQVSQIFASGLAGIIQEAL